MMRTRAEIKRSITMRFMQNVNLQAAYGFDPNQTFEDQFSKVSFENIMIELFTTVHLILEQLFDTHRTELNGVVESQKLHSGAWLRNQLLNFQYGFDLIPNTDRWNNGAATPEQIDESRIIKYAAVTERDDAKGVVCKIATETNGVLSPLSNVHIDAITSWLKKIKAAGVPHTIINFLPDKLQLNIRIYRNPLILDQNGVHRLNGGEPVRTALEEFMKELPFNGELILQQLQDKLQAVDGVEIVQIDSALSSWINAETNNYGAFTVIDVRRLPASGYFAIENFDGITYV